METQTRLTYGLILTLAAMATACGSSGNSGVGGIPGGQAGGGTPPPAGCGPGYQPPFSYGVSSGQEISYFNALPSGTYQPISMEYFVPGEAPLHYRQDFNGMTAGPVQPICGTVHQPGRPNPPARRVRTYSRWNLDSGSAYYFGTWSFYGTRSHSQISNRRSPESRMFYVPTHQGTEVIVHTKDSQTGAILVTRYRLVTEF